MEGNFTTNNHMENSDPKHATTRNICHFKRINLDNQHKEEEHNEDDCDNWLR